ncbi:MAG: hypothetical protein ACHQAX_03025 [Gammaproteobacteria bacterium]
MRTAIAVKPALGMGIRMGMGTIAALTVLNILNFGNTTGSCGL